MNDRAPTVIVSRRVRAGYEEEFRHWNDRLIAAAERFHGLVGSEVQPPDGAHPGQWVNIYRFDTPDRLELWLVSTERARLMTEGAHLCDGHPQEHRIAEPDQRADVVTAVVSKRIRGDSIGDYRRAQAELDNAMSRFPGFIRSGVSEPVPGIQDEHVTIFTFDSRENLDNWLGSDERQETLELLEELVEGDYTMSFVDGFAGWFQDSPSPTPRWKQASTVMLALFPTLIVFRFIQQAIVPDAPWLLALFVSNVASISLLTWVLMPFLTRKLAPWLRNDSSGRR